MLDSRAASSSAATNVPYPDLHEDTFPIVGFTNLSSRLEAKRVVDIVSVGYPPSTGLSDAAS